MKALIIEFVATLLDTLGRSVGYTRTEIIRGRKERSYGGADTEEVKQEVGEMIQDHTKVKVTPKNIIVDSGDKKLKIRRK